MINIHNLHKEILERESKKNKIYETVYGKVINKIKYTNKFSDSCFCIFQCPNFVYGCPLYDINSCIMFIMQKLIDNYFEVNYTAPNLIFISWQNIPNKSKNYDPHEITERNYLNTNNMITLYDYKKEKESKESIIEKKNNIFNEIDQEFIKNSTNLDKYIPPNSEVFPTNINDNNYQNSNKNQNNKNNQKNIILSKMQRDNGPLSLVDLNTNIQSSNYSNFDNMNLNNVSNGNNYLNNNNLNNNYLNNNNFNSNFNSNFNNNLNNNLNNNIADYNLKNNSNDIDNILNELDTSTNNDDSVFGTLL